MRDICHWFPILMTALITFLHYLFQVPLAHKLLSTHRASQHFKGMYTFSNCSVSFTMKDVRAEDRIVTEGAGEDNFPRQILKVLLMGTGSQSGKWQQATNICGLLATKSRKDYSVSLRGGVNRVDFRKSCLGQREAPCQWTWCDSLYQLAGWLVQAQNRMHNYWNRHRSRRKMNENEQRTGKWKVFEPDRGINSKSE